MTSAEWAASAYILFECINGANSDVIYLRVEYILTQDCIYFRGRKSQRSRESSYPKVSQGYIHEYVSDKLSIEPDTQSGTGL